MTAAENRNPATEDGFFCNLPFEEYQDLSGLNQTTLKQRLRGVDSEKAQKNPIDQQIIGHAGHCLVLEPDRFHSMYVRAPDGTGGGKQTTQQARLDFQQHHPGKIILRGDVWNRLLAAERTLRVHPRVHEWMGEGDPEISAFWKDPQTGIRCKGRLDWYNPELDMIMDLKFTGCVKHSLCLRRIERHHYDLQAAWYCRAVKALRGSQPVFAVVYIETVRPHQIAPIVLSPADLERGEQKIHEALHSLPDVMTAHAVN